MARGPGPSIGIAGRRHRSADGGERLVLNVQITEMQVYSHLLQSLDRLRAQSIKRPWSVRNCSFVWGAPISSFTVNWDTTRLSIPNTHRISRKPSITCFLFNHLVPQIDI